MRIDVCIAYLPLFYALQQVVLSSEEPVFQENQFASLLNDWESVIYAFQCLPISHRTARIANGI